MRTMDTGSTERIAFVGGGNMARALIAGLLRQGMAPGRIGVGEPHAAARASLEQDFGVRTSPDNAAAIAGAALVVLAVKPQDAPAVLRGLQAGWDAAGTVLLSIAPGVTVAELASACVPGVTPVRAMPNRPALVGAGITGLYAPPQTPAPACALAERVGTAAGRVVWLRAEAELDVVTALSGSGPAYFFRLAEQLAQAGTALGLERDTAAALAIETLHGAGLLARHAADRAGAAHAQVLDSERRAVTSRGGTTEAALRVLDEGGFDALITRAVQAAAARSAQLATGRPGAPQREPG